MTAEHFRRKYSPDRYGEYRHREELRKFLRDYTRYKDRQIDTIVVLLDQCLLARDDDPTDREKARIRRDARNKGRHCYTCGEELDYQNNESWLFASVDHYWPKSMGGLSNPDNLQVTCKRCNNHDKKDFVDASDYHFEEITLVSASYEEYMSRERNRQYEVAVFAKTYFTCAVCGQPADRVGKLHIGRRELSDSWHFLNLVAYCSEHTPEE
jgi:5-methylcytosine-specific restriction endonuclease McrA